MLLRNESRVKHSIQIKLVFDDNRKREIEICECDKIQVSYRKNGCIRYGVGVIRDIKPYAHSKKWQFCKRESATITLDMSEDLVSCVDKIDMFDIIDIRKVIERPTNSNTEGSDFEIVKPNCKCNCNQNVEDETTNSENEETTEEGVVSGD